MPIIASAMYGTPRVRAFAAVLSLVPVIGALIVGLLILVLLTFPFENSEPLTADEKRWLGLLITGFVAAFVLSVLQLALVAIGHMRPACVVSLLHLAVATGMLWLALEESQGSDGTVLAFFAVVELCGLGAAAIGAVGRVEAD